MDRTCASATLDGDFELLKALRARGKEFVDGWTCAYAAKSGRLDILQWARANGAPWDKWTCAHAAESGALDALKWAHANGCPMDEWTCAYAAKEGRMDVLRWARSAGCPFTETAVEYAEDSRHYDAVAYLRDERRAPSRCGTVPREQATRAPPSRPVAPVTLFGDARSRYVEKCRDVRSWLETLAHDPAPSRANGVKRRLEAHFPGSGGRWLADLYAEMCEVAHNMWTSRGDPAWLSAAEAAARNNFVPPCCRRAANGRRPRNRRRG
jgi:hypothetical protein